MAALVCDICGGTLEMDASGEFATCDSCGLRHTKERMKAKIQEIQGVVEVTKGEVEKQRLLKNAETFLRINEPQKAEAIYKELMQTYPDDETAYVEYLKMLFSKLSPRYTRKEYAAYVELRDRVGKNVFGSQSELDIDKVIKIIKNLCGSKYDGLIEHLWVEQEKKNDGFAVELIDKYNAGEISLYTEVPGKNSAYGPIFKTAKENATKLKGLINGADATILLKRFEKKFVSPDVDGFTIPKRVVDIVYVSPREIICCCVGAYLNEPPHTFDSVKIVLPRVMTIEEIANIIIENHQMNAEASRLLPQLRDHEAALREIFAKCSDNDMRVLRYKWESNFRYKITKINTDEFEYVVNYQDSDRNKSETKKAWYKRGGNFKDVILILRKYSHKCLSCGGDLKGFISKTCSVCGKPKSY